MMPLSRSEAARKAAIARWGTERPPKPDCSIEGCNRPRKYANGLCGTHYERLRRLGSTNAPSRPSRTIPIEDRFWQHVRKSDGCWLWIGSLDKSGYGQTRVDGKSRRAHLIACELYGRPCPPGLVADHECHNADPSCPGGLCIHRRCVRPDHIRFVDRATNARLGRGLSMVAWREGTCQNGHKRTPENTYWRKDRPGKRECRECERERRTQWRRDGHLR